jgi:hypothetical protein
MVSLF